MIGFIDTEETIHELTEAEQIGYDAEAAADIENSEGVNVTLIDNLRNQFSREIAEWKDGVRAS